MPSSVDLRQQRAREIESMRAILDAAEAEDRDLTGDEQQTFNRHDESYQGLTIRIERQEGLEQREADTAVPIGRQPGDRSARSDVNDDETRRQRRSAFIEGVRRGFATLAPEQRALVENSSGDIIVPEDLETEIVRALPDLNVLRGLADVQTTGSDRIRRRALGETSVTWGKLETGATVSDSMPSTPTEEYVYVEDQNGLAKIGIDILADTDFNLDAYVADSFARACADSEETAFATGAGHASSVPEGFAHSISGVPTVTAAGASAITFDDILNLRYALPAKYDRNGAWLANRSTQLAMRKLKDSTGNYLWQVSVQQGQPNTLDGRPIYTQDDMANIATTALTVAYGDWKTGYRIYDRKGMTVQRLAELYAVNGQIGFLVHRRVAGFVPDPQALRILKQA